MFSAKVVIGDLDVRGAEAVVSTIIKDGGYVTLTVHQTVTVSRLRVPAPPFFLPKRSRGYEMQRGQLG